jgi:hypothetical protein
MSIDDVRLLEGSGSEATTFAFTVTLSVPSGSVVPADPSTADGTAVAGPS